jgi:hypothetical protein
MRNSFKFFVPPSISRLRFYKLKLTRNGAVSGARARLFSNPQFTSSRFRFVYAPVSDSGSKSFYTGFSYKYFLSKWKKFEHKKILSSFIRPNRYNFPTLLSSLPTSVADYQALVKVKSFISRKKGFKYFVTRSRVYKKNRFVQYFNSIRNKVYRSPKNAWKKRALKRRIFRLKRSLLIRFSRRIKRLRKSTVKFSPLYIRKKGIKINSFFPKVFRKPWRLRKWRVKKNMKKKRKWKSRKKKLAKIRLKKLKLKFKRKKKNNLKRRQKKLRGFRLKKKNGRLTARKFLRTSAFRFISRLNSLPNGRKVKHFSSIRLKNAIRHFKTLFVHSIFDSSFLNTKLNRGFGIKSKGKFRRGREMFKKIFRKQLKKRKNSLFKFSLRWVWKLRNHFKLKGKNKLFSLFKFIVSRYFSSSNFKTVRSGAKQKFKTLKPLKNSEPDPYNEGAFYKLLKKAITKVHYRRPIALKPKAYVFTKRFYYSQIYRRRLLIKCFRLSSYFFLFAKICSLRRNTKFYAKVMKKFYKIILKLSVKGRFVYLMPFLFNRNRFSGLISLVNSDFYSRNALVTANFSSIRRSRSRTHRVKYKI